MAIGTTGTYDPATGERRETEFSYTPVDPQQDMMRQAFEQSQAAFNPPPPQPRGPTPYWENPETYYPRQQQIDPIAQAKAATMAAQKFIAFRGYQSDLKEGMAAADAFAKWGPMLVQDTSFGPSMKAMTPPVVKPSYAWDKQNQAFMAPGQRPVFRPNAPAITAPRIDQITMADYNDARKEFNTALKEYTNDDNSEEIKLEARKRMESAKVRMNNISTRGQSPQSIPQAEPSAPAPAAPMPNAPTAPVVIRLTKDGKKAEFDAATKKFLRYAE